MSSMHKVQVDEHGTEIAYIDSGAPSGDSYTTIVCVHGHSYHAQNFSKLFPLAQKHNLRIIALNRRDYVGSTPFTSAELDALKSDDEDILNGFMSARGLEIARFLVWVIEELKIPRATEDGTTGGLALLGWSLGNITTLAFLGNLASYSHDVVKALEPYLRTVFLYELPDNSLGYPRPEGYYNAFEDTSVPERIRGIVFGKWVSSYYTHPAYSSSSSSEAQSHSSSVFPPGSRTIDTLQLRAPKKATRPCTLDRITPRDLLACVDAAPGVRSEWLIWRLPTSVLHEHKCRAMLMPLETKNGPADAGDVLNAVLPNLKIRVICGLVSLWVVQWETWAFEEECLRWPSEGKTTRPVKFIPVEDANHFLHWDDPETFMKLCSNGIRS